MNYRVKGLDGPWPLLRPRGRDVHRIARNILAALFWPALAAVIYIIRYPRTKEALGIVVFCGYVGWTLTPTSGSDSHTYMNKILDYREGLDGQIKEPLLRGVVEVINFFHFSPQWYFVLLGVVFAIGWIWCGRLIFERFTPDRKLGVVALLFLGAFFIYYPIFPAVNARYTTSMWLLFAATLLALDSRWRMAIAVAVVGASIHFGHVMFLGALSLLYLSRYLKNLQLIGAYFFLFVCMLLPPQFILNIGNILGDSLGGSLGGTIDSSVHFGERRLAGEFDGRTSERSWFMGWFRQVIFWAALISGHFLFWKYCRQNRRDYLFQLWILIVVMWGLYYAMSAHSIAASRLRRNTTGLLLMWHALYFLRYSRGYQISLAILAGPAIFYYTVAYRIWLHQISVAAFLPLPFAFFPDWWPRVMEMLGFG